MKHPPERINELLRLLAMPAREDLPASLLQSLRRRLCLLSPESVASILSYSQMLNPKCLEVVRTVVHDSMTSKNNFSFHYRELESRILYAISGAKTMAAFVIPDYYTITLVGIRQRCIELGFTDDIDLLDEDTPHVEVWKGMLIEDAIFNYAFEEPRYFEYLGEHADDLLPHAEMLTGDAPAGHHRVSIEMIESLLVGGSPKLLEGVL